MKDPRYATKSSEQQQSIKSKQYVLSVHEEEEDDQATKFKVRIQERARQQSKVVKGLAQVEGSGSPAKEAPPLMLIRNGCVEQVRALAVDKFLEEA